MPNRLRDSASPYLRQHADNPVDWHDWGPEALALARTQRRPILLSIGYAACHWCHVMAHESFENERTAALMNELFVNIKVDREERPDLDAIYMQAVQALTGHGGWPMTVFLTPDGEPFHGGTYFPPEDRHGMPSFERVLRAVAGAWQDKRDDVAAAGRSLTEHIRRAATPLDTGGPVGRGTLDEAFRGLARTYDERHGGFGGAPKFPPSMALDFLLRHWARTGAPLARDIVSATFAAMHHGGICDQVGGGLHRYSVDDRWLVPHFEKMLYDNALFARLGVRVWQVTRDPAAREATEQTLDWIVREMLDDGGAFHSSLDADSEGHEGRFYVWSWDDFVATTGADATIAAAYWGVTPAGNFEGSNILFVPHGVAATAARAGVTEDQVAPAIARARSLLYEARSRRVWPTKDGKVIASWNGLAIRAFVEAARAFSRADYLAAAHRAGGYLARQLVRDGRVSRAALGARVSGPGMLEDAAAVALAFLDLFGATGDTGWLDESRNITERAIELFHEPASGSWFDTPADGEPLIVRPRDLTDNATPAGTSLMAELLASWADLDERGEWRSMAVALVDQGATALSRYPLAVGHLAGVADTLVNGSVQVALVGDPAVAGFGALAERLGTVFLPGLVVATGRGGEELAVLRDRRATADGPAAFVCRGSVCDVPTSDPDTLELQLRRHVDVPGPAAQTG